MINRLWLTTLLLPIVSTSPAPTKAAVTLRQLQQQQPIVTPSPSVWNPTKTYKRRRDIGSDLSELGGDIKSILSDLGSDIPSYVASGIPNFFQNFPSGDDVLSSLGIQSSQLAALPTQVLNVPGYANYTNQGWNLRFHGNVYKQPNTTESRLNDLANAFLIGTSVQDLPPSQASQARNLTAEIFVAQQKDQNVTFSLAPAPTAGATGTDGGAIEAPGGAQIVRFPYETTDEGDFDDFVQIQSNGLLPGNATNHVQVLNVYTQGANLGNATAWLVPDTGFTIISDIDDILRVTKIYEPKEGILNSFARPFTPWMNMPEIYANWSASIPDFHFHYLTTTPEQVTRNYMDFIYNTYPGGSFDTRPLNFSNVEETLKVRKVLLEKIFQTFPKRKFILIADTSNSDVMKDYPMMVTEFPGQVQCIFLRNTSATDPGDRFPYDTSGFRNINQQSYMFFHVPDDLRNLDIVNGQCLNTTIPQNVTFSIQGLPFGLSKSNDTNKSAAVHSHNTPNLSRWFGWGLLTLGVWAVL